MRIEAQRELLAPPDDVWALLAEPYHLADWWPGYASVRPDRRGFADGARWQVTRSPRPGFFRRADSEGNLVIARIEPHRALAWNDLEQRFAAEITIAPGPQGRTLAALTVEAPWLRFAVEELRRAPRQALSRLHALCQTAARL